MTTPNDREVIELSNDPQADELLFSKRECMWQNDNNGMSYQQNGQILFDLTTLKNNPKSINFKDSLLTIPVLVEAAFATPLGAAVAYNDFLVCMKNGSFNCIENVWVNIDGVEFTIAGQNLAPYLQYKMLTHAGSNDLQSVLQTYNYYPDTPDSIQFCTVANSTASTPFLGEANNAVIGSNLSPFINGWAGYQAQNDGRNRRMVKSNFNSANTAAGNLLPNTVNNAPVNGVCPMTQQSQTVYKDCVLRNGVCSVATPNQYAFMLVMKLGFLHDVFEKMPLVAGAAVKLTINTSLVSSSTINFTYNPGATTTPYKVTSYTSSTAYNKLPFQVSQPVGNIPTVNIGYAGGNYSSAAAPLAINSWGAVDGSLTINSFIARSPTTNTQAFSGVNACRLCLITYDFTPEAQIKYLTLHSQPKRVIYNDVQCVPILASTSNLTAAGTTSVQLQLVANMARVKHILIVPYIASSYNPASTTTGATTSPMNSPFAGTNIAPFVKWSGMNILVNNVPHFRTPLNYGFEQFTQEIKQFGAINGAETLGLSSGLLSQYMWETGYPYFFVDLTRAEDVRDINIAKTYGLSGTIASNFPLDLYCYLIFDREFNIDVKSGQISSN